jgi:hypothetical protein
MLSKTTNNDRKDDTPLFRKSPLSKYPSLEMNFDYRTFFSKQWCIIPLFVIFHHCLEKNPVFKLYFPKPDPPPPPPPPIHTHTMALARVLWLCDSSRERNLMKNFFLNNGVCNFLSVLSFESF